MFKKTSFSSTDAQETLASLEGKYVLEAGTDVKTANDILEKVIFALNIYADAPKYVLTRAMYPETGTFEEARFVVRPAAKSALEVSEMKKVLAIPADEKFFDKFIKEMAIWFDEYAYFAKLDENVKELNAKVAEITEGEDIPFGVKFTVGSDIVEVSDTDITIGLTVDTVLNLASVPLFDENFPERAVKYGEGVVETLKSCVRPWDLLKTKSTFTKDLNLGSRRSIVKLMRKVVNRNLAFVRVGTGYVDTDNYFAIVEKVAITPEEAVDFEGAKITENDKISKVEAKAGKTQIATYFKVSPITEKGEPVEVGLDDVLAEVE
jgi:hypothetical protein